MIWVFCTVQREKLHKWDGAVKLEEVSYLANLHRHVFHFKVTVEVFHDDREIEFIMLKHRVEKIVDKWPAVVGSCETMAEDLFVELNRDAKKERHYRIEVSEDGENGAVFEK